MYERRHEALISRRAFVFRLTGHLLAAVGMIALSLFLGMAGYRAFERLSWRDAFLNASMLLGGMGPVDVPRTNSGKIFAGLYALYAGLVFLIVASVIFAPVFHRVLHRFHLGSGDEQS